MGKRVAADKQKMRRMPTPGTGAQLEHLHDSMWVPIAFFSRKLSSFVETVMHSAECYLHPAQLSGTFAICLSRTFHCTHISNLLLLQLQAQQTVLPGNLIIFSLS